jgi:chemotaxis protein CheZ
MTGPRKVFRIEQLAALRIGAQIDDPHTPHHAELMEELGALRAMLADAPARRSHDANAPRRDDIGRLTGELRLIQSAIGGLGPEHGGRGGSHSTAHIAGELNAVMQGSEQATQKILAAAEDIDQAANNLSAALKDDFEQGLSQDIRDRVLQIFEACNFQDLTSQRIAKVMASLGRLEHQIAGALDELKRVAAAPPVHGPSLPGDRGHVSQSDVDRRRCRSGFGFRD